MVLAEADHQHAAHNEGARLVGQARDRPPRRRRLAVPEPRLQQRGPVRKRETLGISLQQLALQLQGVKVGPQFRFEGVVLLFVAADLLRGQRRPFIQRPGELYRTPQDRPVINRFAPPLHHDRDQIVGVPKVTRDRAGDELLNRALERLGHVRDRAYEGVLAVPLNGQIAEAGASSLEAVELVLEPELLRRDDSKALAERTGLL